MIENREGIHHRIPPTVELAQKTLVSRPDRAGTAPGSLDSTYTCQFSGNRPLSM